MLHLLPRLMLMVFTVGVFNSCKQSVTDPEQWHFPAFEKVDSVNPVLVAGPGRFRCPVLKDTIAWENKDVFNPAAVVHEGKVWLLYRAEDTIGRHNGTSRLGLAVSDDGLKFRREPLPVFYPDEDSMKSLEWEGGVEDPRLVRTPGEVGMPGGFLLTYTAYDGKVARLCMAFSDDLRNWKKAGPVLRGRFRDTWSKSGAVVVEQHDDAFIARRIKCSSQDRSLHDGDCPGHFWMYFGDTDLFMAWSDDLLHWQPLEENGKLKPVMHPRAGMFDSRLVEPGPFALFTESGIILLYNGMNLEQGGDVDLPAGAYCTGQALFMPEDPRILKNRAKEYFLRPDKPYEISGQVNQVCFIEGLVWHQGRWMLYYGTADSRIAVAVTR